MTVAPTNLAAISNDTIITTSTTILRPTEAQLRYAQFHYKRRAQAVKHRIDQLHQTPLEVTTTTMNSDDNNKDDDNSHDSNDNNSSASSGTDTSDVELRAIRLKRRPMISVGRRALLENSKHRYRRRRKDISKYGYCGCFLDQDDEGVEVAVPRSDMVAAETSDDDDNDINDNIEDEGNIALDEIFMTWPKQQRRGTGERRRRRANSAFQTACHAMMKNIQTSQTKDVAPSITALSKRWKRSEEHVAAAAAQQDFYKYKTRGMGRSNNKQQYGGSARSASLLLSYAYYQQHTMDQGASWLTHLPAKQSKGRNNPNSLYYFHDLNGLPPSNYDDDHNEDDGHYSDDGNESSITLSMRKPGPQKFHRLMAFVQQRLIEKQQQQQQQIDLQIYDDEFNYDGLNSSGRRRTKEISKSIELIHKNIITYSSNNDNNENNNHTNQIQQIRNSLEGNSNNTTPTMTLRNDTPFSRSSSTESQKQRRRGRSRYVPRIRLREFITTAPTTTTPLPRKKLIDRFQVDISTSDDFIDGRNNDDDYRDCNSRTEEIALTFESDGNNNIKNTSQLEEVPRMKLKDHFINYEIEETKASEENSPGMISRTSIDRLSIQFEGKYVASSVNKGCYISDDAINQRRVSHDKRHSSGSKTSDFFARVRSDTDKQQQNQNKSIDDFRFSSSTTDSSRPRRVSSDTLSDISAGSNLSGLWSRGRNSLSTLTTNLNTIAETQTNKGKALLPPEIIGRASDVSGRVSGFFNKFRGVQEDNEDTMTQDQQFRSSLEKGMDTKEFDQNQKLMPSQSCDSHEALRAYRKNRESMSPEDSDQISLASSFHALPDQIRKVVQNSGSSFPETNNDDERYISPSRTTVTQSTMSDLSAEQYRRAHGRVLKNSVLLGGDFEHQHVIDTDETQSDMSSAVVMDPQTLANLMMSPDILQKRLNQAIATIEQRKWDQFLFLINANPWLAEMKELTTNQYLLHKLAFFGKGTPPAPMSLCERLVEKFSAAVHKFDQDGNVPLHLAAAAGNLQMIELLGDKFQSGASIRNEDGMLPLHFTIASFADFIDENDGEDKDDNTDSQPLGVIKTVLKLFPKAVAIADNDGNLPLHVAAECLYGETGVDVVYLLMDEANRQLHDPSGVRFRNKIKLEEVVEENMSNVTMSTERDTDSSVLDTEMHCSMVLNDYNETPLLAATRSRKGWQMIEAILTGPGGRNAALNQDSDKNNALHLLVGEFQDATAAMSVLKIAPESAVYRNSQGILPIEMACIQLMPEEVILAIALVDLPIDIDDKDGIKVHEGHGESWSFLCVDNEDHMVNIVEEIVSICSFQQLQEMCFMKYHDSGSTIVDNATPKCREVLNRALRFLGRFEFVGNGPLFSDIHTGFKAFDALDFGIDDDDEGKRVLLECYTNEFDFENRVYTMFDVELDSHFVEEVNVYVQHMEETANNSNEEAPRQSCVAIERPQLTLDKVVDGMSKNGGYDNRDLRLKFSSKICSVLRLIGKALRHLHLSGVVHGNVCMETCGKFEDSWKILERLEVQAIGKPFDPTRFRHAFPPESLELSLEHEDMIYDSDSGAITFKKDMTSEISIDIWMFGAICYESLVGRPLIEFDTNNESSSDDVVALLQTMEWDESNMEDVFADLLDAGINEGGADMITSCLFPRPEQRSSSMDEILENPFWKDIQRQPKGKQKGGDSVNSSKSLLAEVQRYEI